MADGRSEIYSSRQSLGIQAGNRQDSFHIIVPSSYSQKCALGAFCSCDFSSSSCCVYFFVKK